MEAVEQIHREIAADAALRRAAPRVADLERDLMSARQELQGLNTQLAVLGLTTSEHERERITLRRDDAAKRVELLSKRIDEARAAVTAAQTAVASVQDEPEAEHRAAVHRAREAHVAARAARVEAETTAARARQLEAQREREFHEKRSDAAWAAVQEAQRASQQASVLERVAKQREAEAEAAIPEAERNVLVAKFNRLLPVASPARAREAINAHLATLVALELRQREIYAHVRRVLHAHLIAWQHCHAIEDDLRSSAKLESVGDRPMGEAEATITACLAVSLGTEQMGLGPQHGEALLTPLEPSPHDATGAFASEARELLARATRQPEGA
jgi:hypothetical protein